MTRSKMAPGAGRALNLAERLELALLRDLTLKCGLINIKWGEKK